MYTDTFIFCGHMKRERIEHSISSPYASSTSKKFSSIYSVIRRNRFYRDGGGFSNASIKTPENIFCWATALTELPGVWRAACLVDAAQVHAEIR